MQNNHLESLRQLNAHLQVTDIQPGAAVQKRLSAAEYAEEVQRYLARVRTAPTQPIMRKIAD